MGLIEVISTIISGDCMAGLVTKKRRHGLGHHELWQVYRDMIYRCYRPKGIDYKWYGAKGIRVCDRWLNDTNGIENFIADMHPRPSKAYRIDRIDFTKNYSPENCRWVTVLESNRNKSNVKSASL